MEQTDERTDLTTTTVEDWAPPCTDPSHSAGVRGHVPADYAAWYMIAPCHGLRAAVCHGRYLNMLLTGTVTCTVCRRQYLIEQYRFEPVG